MQWVTLQPVHGPAYEHMTALAMLYALVGLTSAVPLQTTAKTFTQCTWH